MSASDSAAPGHRRLASRLLMGIGFGWVGLPIIVIADGGARDIAGSGGTFPIVVDLFAGVAVGIAVRILQLNWLGLAGFAIGAISEAWLPSWTIPAVVNVAGPVLAGYEKYVSGIVAASLGSMAGFVIGGRIGVRVSPRPLVTAAIGLAILAAWTIFWLLWAEAVRGM